MGITTANWSIRPGVVNKWGVTVNASAEDVKPSNACYVAIWGNDTLGNGSRNKPYRTINKGISIGGTIIAGSGTFRERLLGNCTLVGDGNVIIDCYTLAAPAVTGFTFTNINVLNMPFSVTGSAFFTDCILKNSPSTSTSVITLTNTLVIDCYFGSVGGVKFTGSTFYRSYIPIRNSNVLQNQNNIFYKCNLDFVGPTGEQQLLDFNLFYQCNFRIVYGVTSLSQTFLYYPAIPSGYVQPSNISDLRTHALGILLNQSFFSPKSNIADPKFNNLTIGDFTLAMDSPARNMSYFGTYAGARSIAKSLAVKADASLSDFDNSTAVNLTIADNSITLTDPDAVGSIESKPQDNTRGRELEKLPTYGTNADRNGQYVDATKDLSDTVISAGTTLSVSTPYRVYEGSITYDSSVITAGNCFTSKPSSPGTFTTATGGVVREIIEAPARENVEARFTNGAVSYISSGDVVTGNWYFVENDTVIYDGVTKGVGTFVKGTATTTFSGSGNLRLVFAAADPFFYFEINQKPTSNNVGNVRTGDITKGNGDLTFDRTTANIFPINKKFYQMKYTIQVDNLTP